MRAFLLALVICQSVLIFSMAVAPLPPITQEQKAAADKTTREEAAEYAPLRRFWNWTAHDPVAFYTSVLALFTGVLGVSTVLLWWETKSTAERQRADTKILQRAYLSVKPLGVSRYGTATGTQCYCDVGFENVGNLPARNVQWFIDRVFSSERFLNNFGIPEGSFQGDNVVPPGTSMRKSANNIDEKSFEAARTRPGDQWLYVWGKVIYNDGFGEKRVTRFCHRYNMAGVRGGEIALAEKNARYHVYGNDAD